MNALAPVLASAALACLAASFQEGHRKPGGHAADNDPRATFENHCARCHVPPDPAFAVDRAWLEQVHDTA